MPLPTTKFSVSYDRTTKIVSTVVCGGLLLIAAAVQSPVAAGIAALSLLLFYAWSPQGYVVSSDSIAIRRLVGTVRVPLDRVQEARLATNEDLSGCIRLWASGGLFGDYGVMRTNRLGTCRWYVTNRSKTVVVRTEDRTVVLSPDEPEALLQAIHAPAAAAPGASGPLFESAGAPDRIGGVVGAVVGILALAIAAFAMLYAPGPPRYTLTGSMLTIHDRFYPVTLSANTVDVAGIRIVDLRTQPEWRPTLKTNGFSNPRYHSGWYRVAGGQTIRLYRATGTRLVLLPPKTGGPPVLMEVPEPERFIKQVRREWTGGSPHTLPNDAHG